MQSSLHRLQAPDGHQILVREWKSRDHNNPQATIQILHGLGEHSGRYERFARACTAAGFVVIAHDHRGHGVIPDGEARGHFADTDGWRLLREDSHLVAQDTAQRHPSLPRILFGHSMGSFLAQGVIGRWPAEFDLLVLSGSTLPNRWHLRLGRTFAEEEILRLGARTGSRFLGKVEFGEYNRHFAPNRTGYDWLSSDAEEVERYVADPLSGGTFSGQLWLDLIRGVLDASKRELLNAIPSGFPILILGGEDDPVGGAHGLHRLSDAYLKTDHSDITLLVYEDGRHEMLNERNRDEVTKDILDWLASRIALLPAKGTRHAKQRTIDRKRRRMSSPNMKKL